VPRCARVAANVLVIVSAGATTGCHVGLFVLVGAASDAQRPYVPEAIAREVGPSRVRTLGCLDVGLVPFERGGSALVDVHVGNRCGYPEALDLRGLVIRGRDAAGDDHDVALVDPRSEIGLVHVGGADRGHERIRLEGAASSVRLCFHLERINPDAPAARPAPLCFERSDDGWRSS
jgi:hypothetical protein